MKQKKSLSVWSILVLVCLLFTACSTKNEPRVASSQPAINGAVENKSLKVTVTNSSDYVFNELYVSPTGSDGWGDDCLGSTNILKKNGSFELTVPTYDFDNYDIKVVDEDDDTYFFKYVKLKIGTEVVISFGDELIADIIHADGVQETVIGELYSEAGGYSGGEEPQNGTVTGTGYDTSGQYTFAVYNQSEYDIYAIYIGVVDASEYDDIDLLPQILSAGDSTQLIGQASQGDWINTEWTLYIEDVDGDVSASYDIFNPWLLTYVDINWDSNSGGYVCEFYYE